MKLFAQTIIIILGLVPVICFAQSDNDEYWTASLEASIFYDDAQYKEAAAAYKDAFKLNKGEEIASHRLYAAASNSLIENEEAVKENLFVLLTVANKTYMRRVLVNYFVFDKYKNKDWWKDLEQKMDQRLARLIAHHKNLKIFKKGRNLKYAAIRTNKEGDTLANTFVHLIPDGTGWGDEAASSQSQVIFKYEFDLQDSIDHYEEVEKTVGHEFWIDKDTTGVIENEKQVWIHPIRNNEFFKTEIAPFPVVRFPISNESIQKEKSKIVIMRNWGIYSPSETETTYQYIGKEKRKYPFQKEEIPCHKFTGEAYNSLHGKSTLEYYFNENFGFTEMIYSTYDGDKIIFEINEIYSDLDK